MWSVDAHLKQLAEVSLQVGAAEEATAEESWHAASDALDRAGEALAAVRSSWPQMSEAERGIVGATAAPLRARLDAVRLRVPRLAAVSEGAVEVDPEQDAEPDAA